MCGIKDDSRFLVLIAQVHERSGTNRAVLFRKRGKIERGKTQV